MRTTVTLDPDVAAMLRKRMHERGVSFKEAINSALRAGLAPDHAAEPFHTPTFDLGGARLPLDRALELAERLGDEDLQVDTNLDT